VGHRPHSAIPNRIPEKDARGHGRAATGGGGMLISGYTKEGREGWRMGQDLPRHKDKFQRPEEKGAIFARVRSDLDRLIQKRKETEKETKKEMMEINNHRDHGEAGSDIIGLAGGGAGREAGSDISGLAGGGAGGGGSDIIGTRAATAAGDHLRLLGPSGGGVKRKQHSTGDHFAVDFAVKNASKRSSENRCRPHTAPLSSTGSRVTSVASALFGGRYTLTETIGQGAYAVVRNSIYEPTGQASAVKVFDKLKSNWEGRRKLVEREIRLMQNICRGNENIVEFHESIDSLSQIFVFMEKLEGSLRQELNRRPLRRFGEEKARSLVAQICNALEYLHSLNVVHRDLKLENLLLDKSGEVVKLVDFGFAVKLQSKDQRLKVFCGTPSYMSPEIVSGKEYSGFCADIWALGVLIFVLLLGRFPFKAQTEHELFQKIRRGAFTIAAGENHVTQVSKRLIRGILRIDPSIRPSVFQVKNHQWVSTACISVKTPDTETKDSVDSSERSLNARSRGERGCSKITSKRLETETETTYAEASREHICI